MKRRGSLPPMDPEISALLERERGAPPPSEVIDRVRSRLFVVGGGGGSGHGGHGGAGHGAAAGVGKAAASLAAKVGAWAASHVATVATTAFVAGGVVSGLAVLKVEERQSRNAYVAPAAPLTAPPASVASCTSTTPRAARDPSTVVASASPPAPPPPPAAPAPSPAPSSSSLARERLLIDDARTALAAGDGARALSLLDDHEHRFTKPQLGEEREALAVQALVAAGRYDEARARAARFRESAPTSLFLPAIDATLASIP